MNLIELNHALRQLRLGGMAAVLETRLHQAQAEARAQRNGPPLPNRKWMSSWRWDGVGFRPSPRCRRI